MSMKTIFGFFSSDFVSAALAGATAQSMAAAANSGQTVVRNLRFTVSFPVIRDFTIRPSLIKTLISTFMGGHPPLSPLRRRASSSGSADGGGAHRAPREHSVDDEAYRGSNQPIEESIDRARITRHVRRRHQDC